MPVLDAKALEIDSKGAAFLLSVLRSAPRAPAIKPKEITPPTRLTQNVRMHFRVPRRLKQFLPDLV